MNGEKLTVGVLLSNSTILPMAKNFNAGLKQGLTGLDVEIVPEFIGQGSKEQAEKAINKLFSFDNSDIITGIVSNKVGYELSEKFEKHKRPFIINNLGEHLPDPSLYNDYTFLNSVHTWQQVWSMGNWGVKTFGKRGMLVSGVYDSGYSFPVMLQKGIQASAADSAVPFAIAPMRQYNGLADVASVIPHIVEFEPDFILATFCGEEASLFLSEYVKHGLHKKIPLLGLPFLLESFDACGETIEVYTTISSYREVTEDEIDRLCNIACDPFAQFGYETGLLIKEAVENSGGKTLQRALAEAAVNTDRGKLEILPRETGNDSRVFLVKNTWSGNKGEISRQVIGELETIGISNQVVADINSQPSSGWVNPYLGI
ncbi:ABC transporter substrate-binding protein [Mucilaginibacter sp.]|jgi:ABC-type branched-subunit amino acid transport system substrate-binding protein|uniref:ABC transporter substrate-binding protein n=1 Tax=Mucilaginibacter sp. TaxID=1882438 RepID=UPI002B7554A3|nr:ABC transporter substrate-binding protein [Mucilaginibacter sp.]HTI60166.1 ABC transporter substrate-binding protein [Mucilaginibacter sp.]